MHIVTLKWQHEKDSGKMVRIYSSSAITMKEFYYMLINKTIFKTYPHQYHPFVSVKREMCSGFSHGKMETSES